MFAEIVCEACEVVDVDPIFGDCHCAISTVEGSLMSQGIERHSRSTLITLRLNWRFGARMVPEQRWRTCRYRPAVFDSATRSPHVAPLLVVSLGKVRYVVVRNHVGPHSPPRALSCCIQFLPSPPIPAAIVAVAFSEGPHRDIWVT